ncbi:MAG: T9SS type A sorting domain-containing protein [Flavobacteriia bacterium]
MKKQLLFATFFLSVASLAQNELNYSNEPAIGDIGTMYEIDPATDPLAGTTGNGITWDFSQISAVSGTPRTIQVIDATTTLDAASYPTSVKAYDAGSTLLNYFNSSAASRISQGFIYDEASFGVIKAVFSTDEQTLLTYPFAYGNSFTDNFAGTLEFNFNGPQNSVCTGVSHATIDGLGTLQLPNSISIPNVLRLKLVDTVYTQVNVVVIGLVDIEFIRTQYEYYSLATGNLPVFSYANVILQQAGATTPLQETNVIYSSVLPTTIVGVEEKTSEELMIYPNPSEGMITLSGDFSSTATATVFDQAGRLVHTTNALQNVQVIDLSALENGTYLLVVTDNGESAAQMIALQ